MQIMELGKLLGDACYVFLALNALWGLYCTIVVWRRLSQLRFRNDTRQDEFIGELDRHLAAKDFKGAAQLCEGDRRALPQLIGLALAHKQLGYAKLRQFVADHFQRDILADLEHRVSWIVTVVKSGPLLGLYGTVLGMMAAFGRIGTGEKVKPEAIADEISIALICTALGLTTAIPFTFVIASLNIRIRKLQDMVSLGLTQFLDSLKIALS